MIDKKLFDAFMEMVGRQAIVGKADAALFHYDAAHKKTETYHITKPTWWRRAFHGAVGLATEAPEVLDLFKKELYGQRIVLSEAELKARLKDELGDVFWYWWLVVKAAGFEFDEVLEANKRKLEGRYGVAPSQRAPEGDTPCCGENR